MMPDWAVACRRKADNKGAHGAEFFGWGLGSGRGAIRECGEDMNG